MAVGDVWRMAIIGNILGQEMVNVVHYQTAISIGPVEDEAPALANAWEEEALQEYLDMLSSAYTISKLEVRGVSNPLIGADLDVSGTGFHTGDMQSLQTAMLLNLKTGFIGRARAGRMYVPAIAESQTTNSQPNSGLVTVAQTFFDAAKLVASVGAFSGYSFTWGVWSNSLTQFLPFTSMTVSPYLATQRRRRPGTGS